jgi:poly-beta-1,6-N-acetyl-D-glucosamine synthase
MKAKGAKPLEYVLVTPARDEAAFIEKTVQSVVSQTLLPLRWVIVSDGSTDGTDEIVQKYEAKHEWIELVRIPERKQRNFGGKVRAFDAGYERLKHLDYQVIGNLDGDCSLGHDHMEYLLGKFAKNPKLGVAGTNYLENSWQESVKYDYRFTNSEDVSGICQLFRRECFEGIGGYKPSKRGGVDTIASVKARMHGWETKVFTGRFATHHRQQGTASTHKLLVEFNNGQKDYLYGGHPLWAFCRAAYNATKRPVIIGGGLILAGYFWAMLSGAEKTVTKDVEQFRRREQMTRLARLLRRMLVLGGPSLQSEAGGMESE